jgi:xanthine dehydrogenase iron-sulfur cluster and FAD-binding subunit A
VEWSIASWEETLEQVLEQNHILGKSTGIHFLTVPQKNVLGVFKNDGPYQAYLDVNDIPELRQLKLDASSGVEIGTGTTLTQAIDWLKKASEMDGYAYTAQMSKHIKRVANVPVRNVGIIVKYT